MDFEANLSKTILKYTLNLAVIDKTMYEIVWPFYLILKTIVIMTDKENFQNNVKENIVMSNGPEPFISNN